MLGNQERKKRFGILGGVGWVAREQDGFVLEVGWKSIALPLWGMYSIFRRSGVSETEQANAREHQSDTTYQFSGASEPGRLPIRQAIVYYLYRQWRYHLHLLGEEEPQKSRWTVCHANGLAHEWEERAIASRTEKVAVVELIVPLQQDDPSTN